MNWRNIEFRHQLPKRITKSTILSTNCKLREQEASLSHNAVHQINAPLQTSLFNTKTNFIITSIKNHKIQSLLLRIEKCNRVHQTSPDHDLRSDVAATKHSHHRYLVSSAARETLGLVTPKITMFTRKIFIKEKVVVVLEFARLVLPYTLVFIPILTNRCF